MTRRSQEPPEVTWPDPELADGAGEVLSPPDVLELLADEPELLAEDPDDVPDCDEC